MIEYVALGDFATAVGFLLASTPEKSARYYRDALCTLALAVSHCKPWVPRNTQQKMASIQQEFSYSVENVANTRRQSEISDAGLCVVSPSELINPCSDCLSCSTTFLPK